MQSAGLQKAVEAVYFDLLPTRGRPFVYLSLELPGPHVDVNVHPTKKEVAFLHEDRLCSAVAVAVRSVLSSFTSSRSFDVSSVVPTKAEERREAAKRKEREKVRNKRGGRFRLRLLSKGGRPIPYNDTGNVLTTLPTSPQENSKDSDRDFEAPPAKKRQPQAPPSAPKMMSLESFSQADPSAPPPNLRRASYDPSKEGKNLVRTSTAAPQGALEPFLRVTQKSQTSQLSQLSQSSRESAAADASNPNPTPMVSHDPSCELYNLDITVPGAFALVCRCGASNVIPQPGPRKVSKVVATPCSYKSILDLRADVTRRRDRVLHEKLRTSTYVGAVNRQRSLVQVGVELLMVNHHDLAKEMFYQLALARFGGCSKGTVGGGEVSKA